MMSDTDGTYDSPADCHPALKTDVILKHLFNYLGVEELKKSRLVCKKWRDSSELIFKQHTVVSFYFSPYNPMQFHVNQNEVNEEKQPESLKDLYKSLGRIAPLDSLRLGGRLPWTEAEIVDFFADEGKDITDLQLKQVWTRHDDIRPLIYDCSHLLGEDLMRNMKKLVINLTIVDRVEGFIIPLCLLENIEVLCLRKCKIILDEHYEKKIAPKELILDTNSYDTRGNEMGVRSIVESVIVNNFISFEKMKKLSLINGTARSELWLGMNSTSNLTMKSVHLNNISIKEWSNANWNIEKLTLEHITNGLEHEIMLEPIRNFKMDVKEIVLKSCDINMVKYLPPSVQKLKIYDSRLVQNWEFDMGQSLINLVSMRIQFLPFKFLSGFYSCPNLRDLELTTSENDEEINMDLIPKNVTNIKIHCFHESLEGCTFISSEKRHLKVLALNSSDLERFSEILDVLQPEIVVFYSEDPKTIDKLQEAIIIHRIITTKLSTQGASIKTYTGSVSDNDNVGHHEIFHPSLWGLVRPASATLCRYVDPKMYYYGLQYGKGLKLTKAEFEKVINF